MYPIVWITEGIYLPTYFLLISLGYCLAIFLVYKICLKKGLSITVAMDLSLLVMISGFIGSRIFHIVWERPNYYLENPLQIFYFWQGGFVFYGGAIISFLTVWVYLRKKAENPSLWLDVFSIPIAAAYSIGRLATFFSGSGFGKPSDLPWAVTYPAGTEAPAHISLHPAPLYAMLWEWLIVGVLVFLLRRGVSIGSGLLFCIFLVFHGLGRLVMEQFRADFRGEVFLNLSVSSWISIAIMSVGAYFLVKLKKGVRV